jgi:hypothetical protein
MLNSIAMGDVIASVPVIKYMIETYYPTHENYRVVAKPHFRELFPFVPDCNFLDYDKKDNMWGIPANYPISTINRKNDARLTRNTPKHMHLSEFASISLADRILSRDHLNYVSLQQVPIDHYGIDFSKAVILITSYRDVTRMWHSQYILEVAEWVTSQGLIPVFIGKTDIVEGNNREAIKPKTSLPDDISMCGVDLRNKTTISELATIFSKAKAVCGLDSGPIHLAGTTNVPIVCGYTSVSSEFRIPIRKDGVTIPIEPAIECIGCESKWHSTYWNFENCYMKHIDCCKQMTSDKFINALNTIFQ